MPTLFDSHEEFNEWFSKDIESHAENKSAIDESEYFCELSSTYQYRQAHNCGFFSMKNFSSSILRRIGMGAIFLLIKKNNYVLCLSIKK